MTLTKNYWKLPEMLRELVENYKRKKLNFDKQQPEKLDPVEDPEKETSIFNHLASNMFIFCNGIDFINSNYNSDNAIT